MVTTLNNTNHDDWCYIRSVSTGNVVSANRGLVNGEEDALRSQVYLYAPKQIDEELWRWDGQYIRNKATGLVLDIRKGRLRLIEDTEICLYNPKPTEEAHNQLWGVRDDVVDALGRRQEGCVVYSVCNAEWVLDVQSMVDGGKLVLFPYQSIDNDSQRWSFVPESAINSPMMSAAATNVSELFSSSSSSSGSSPSSPIYDLSSPPPGAEFANGLSPAKRGSQSSVTMLSTEAYKECHQMVYLERNPHLRQVIH
ncbi:hypothetical protein DFQ28_001155 [Apophysomyces sp. BC1034]|nr:hypothetical protein DFQ30_003755 [Apophysomyces sp. BC1015]KAG0180423.1 hypothetical protein DFQ29_000716 [Apophysomyces sp. BC1021]KAG0190991.1 hypothetical protein DFQ28_001155 [Apophysomyces sp. BC1034]